MCGICGTVGFAERHQLEVMTEAIVHRGPDDGGIKILQAGDGRPIVGLGNRRLSIIDLSAAGHMPMSNEDGRVWLTYNGEVYNFQDFRGGLESKGHVFRSRTDTEVLIHLYEEHGSEMLSKLNGMFAFALWDDRDKSLLLARDPFGIKPLYYLPLGNGRLAFASEVKCFVKGGLLRPEINLDELPQFLNYLWVPGPGTLFKGVFKLPPGHLLLWKDGQYTVRGYSDIRPVEPAQAGSDRELIEQLRSILRSSIKRQLVSDVPLGVFLSGGVDSSALLALSSRITGRPMKAFTITYRSKDARDEQSDEDPKFARLVAQAFGAEHQEIEVQPDIAELLPQVTWQMDEPVADPAAISSFLICKAARPQVTVLLSGQGGDEVFGGYRVHLADRISRPLGVLPGPLRRSVLLPLWDGLPRLRNVVPGVSPGKVMAYHRYFRKILMGAGLARAERYVYHRSYYAPAELEGVFSREVKCQLEAIRPYDAYIAYLREVPNASFLDRMLYADQRTFLPELNLTYTDKTSMANSVEVRVPFLDLELASFMRSIPPRCKIRGLTQKWILKRAMEGILPAGVINRGKAAFGAPIRKWLRTDLSSFVDEHLNEKVVKDRGLLDPKVVRSMVRDHTSGRTDHSHRIWAFLTLEIWLRLFVDGSVTTV